MFKSSKPSRDLLGDLGFLFFGSVLVGSIFYPSWVISQDLRSGFRNVDHTVELHRTHIVANTAEIKKLGERFLTENKALKEQLSTVEQQLEASQKQLAMTHAHITALNARTDRLEEELKRAVEQR